MFFSRQSIFNLLDWNKSTLRDINIAKPLKTVRPRSQRKLSTKRLLRVLHIHNIIVGKTRLPNNLTRHPFLILRYHLSLRHRLPRLTKQPSKIILIPTNLQNSLILKRLFHCNKSLIRLSIFNNN